MSELFTLDTLQEFWAKRPKGAKLQYLDLGTRNNWITTKVAPSIGDCSEIWRWEPQSKSIDLSPLVGSDVLCEFSDDGKNWKLGYLDEIDGIYFDLKGASSWNMCRPVMGKWIAIDKDMVIPEGLECTVVYVGGWVSEIKLVKFTGLKEGYHWSWEDK